MATAKPALNSTQLVALKEAADWYSQLCDDGVSETQQQAWQSWLQGDDSHRWAWSQIDRLQQRFRQAPPRLACNTLERAHQHQLNRRSMLKSVALLVGASGLGLGVASREQLWADQVTAAGEVRSIQLSDQSQLVLNSSTRININFNASARVIELLSGELMITTGHPAGEQRPLIVETPNGSVQALGTRFSVVNEEGRSTLRVYQDKVALLLDNEQSLWQAGEWISFTREGVAAHGQNTNTDDAWSRGLLIVNNQPLDQFLQHLGQHRAGLLRVDPRLSQYHISGSFRITDTDQALAAVARSFPVEVNYLTPWWVNVSLR